MKKVKKQQFISAHYAVALLIGSFVIAIAIIINAIVLYIIAQQPKPLSPEKVYENLGYVNVGKSPMLGKKNAPVTVIEYTDFDCPICEAATQQIMPRLQEEYIDSGKVRFVFKSLPIVQLHSNAFHKTEAAYCARAQGGDTAFFKYYNALFTNFGFELNIDNTLRQLAAAQNLNEDQFMQCLHERTFKKHIEDEVLEGTLIGSLGTPTWLIGKTEKDGLTNAIKVSGLLEYESFKTIIDKQLQ